MTVALVGVEDFQPPVEASETSTTACDATLDPFTRRLLASSPDCVKLLSLNGQLLFMSAGGRCAMEVDDFDSQLKGADWVSIWHVEDQPKVRAALEAALAGGTGRFQAFRETAKGAPRWWDVTVSAITDDVGAVEKLLSVSRDISELKQVEERLRQSEMQLRAVLDTLPECVKVVSADGKLIDMNPAGQAMLSAASAEGLLGSQVADFVDAADRPLFEAAHRAAVDGYPFVDPIRFGITGLDGSRRRLASRSVPLRAGTASVVSVLSIARDVTAEEEAEERLQRSESLARDRLAELEQIYRYAPVGLFTFDHSYRFTRINERMAEINGLAVDEHAGKTIWDVVPDLADHLVQVYRPVLERGEAITNVDIEGETPAAPGVIRNWLASYFPLKSAGGEVAGLIGAVLDVTERKRADEKLAESEARFRNMADHAPVMMWVTNPSGDCTYLNKAWHDFTGQSRTDALGKGWVNAVHPEDREHTWNAFARANASRSGFRIEYRLRSLSGAYRWVIDAASARFSPDGEFLGYIGSVLDIDERREAEEKLRTSEELLAQAVATAELGIFDHDHQTESVLWSPAFKRMLGLGVDERVSLDLYVELVHPDDRASFAQAVARAHDPTGDGRCLSEHRIVSSSGDVRWVSVHSQTYFESVGMLRTPRRTVGAVQDITERRRAAEELKEAQASLMRVSRLSAMGAMASTLAHELNQPLTAASNYFAVIRRALSKPAPLNTEALRTAAQEGTDETLRAGEIIRRIRGFAVEGRVKPEPGDLLLVIDAAWKEVRSLDLAAGVEFVRVRHRGSVMVEMDTLQIEQVLVNLFRNALEAMEGCTPRRLVLSLRQTIDEVELTVADTGPGLSSDSQAHLFEPFRTSKQNGLGLGLPMCRTIVEAHGGRIRAEQSAAGGAAFVMTLPAAVLA